MGKVIALKKKNRLYRVFFWLDYDCFISESFDCESIKNYKLMPENYLFSNVRVNEYSTSNLVDELKDTDNIILNCVRINRIYTLVANSLELCSEELNVSFRPDWK